MSILCIFNGHCADPVAAAVIGGTFAIVGVFVNCLLGLLTLHSTRQHNAAVLAQNVGIEDVRSQWALKVHAEKARIDIRVEAIKVVLERLRDLQRAAEDTERSAHNLSNLQFVDADGSKPESQDRIVAEAGNFLVSAAGIFVKPKPGVPNLPGSVEDSYRDLCRSVVRVALLFDLKFDQSRKQDIEDALGQLESAVAAFKVQVAEQERLLTVEESVVGKSIAVMTAG